MLLLSVLYWTAIIEESRVSYCRLCTAYRERTHVLLSFLSLFIYMVLQICFLKYKRKYLKQHFWVIFFLFSFLTATELKMLFKAFLDYIHISQAFSGVTGWAIANMTIHSGYPFIALESRKHCTHGWSGKQITVLYNREDKGWILENKAFRTCKNCLIIL